MRYLPHLAAVIWPLVLALVFSTPAAAQDLPYPPGNVVIASSGNVANAVATATIAAQAGKTNYLTGMLVTAGGATAASVVTCTLTGLQGGNISFIFGVPAGAGVPAAPLVAPMPHPHPASGANVAIVASCPALGAGNTRMVVTIRGYFK